MLKVIRYQSFRSFSQKLNCVNDEVLMLDYERSIQEGCENPNAKNFLFNFFYIFA